MLSLARWQRRLRNVKLLLTIGLASVCFTLMNGRVLTGGPQEIVAPGAAGPFTPSNARTEDGGFISESQFFPAARCTLCHQDTHAAWSESLHRNAAREPFYRESADILMRSRGIEMTRHCESCHSPVALFAGILTKASGKTEAPFTALDDEGVTCSVCHSITEARLDGTGSYTIRRPALLARDDGTPIYGDITDAQILADIPAHKRAVMRPLLRTPEFCATCHKSDAPPELNGYKNLRGFSAYDEWQQSGASHETVAPFYRRPQRTDCRACHMPQVASRNDRAAKNGMLASHRWLGANTAAPLFYGQVEQARLTEKFLQANVLEVVIFALQRPATGEVIAPLADNDLRLALKPGEEVTAEVVISNRNAAHSFPPELRDLYEPWVEFEVVDAAGRTVFHSGFVKPDGALDESAHVYKAILLDEMARPITRHQVWASRVKAYDNAIPPGRSDIARYRFRVPERASKGLTLRAWVNYRRFIQEYTDYVLQRQKARLTVPVVRMAEAQVRLGVGGRRSEVRGRSQWTTDNGRRTTGNTAIARRWNDYGIGLMEQAQYGAAAAAFLKASELDPTSPNYLASSALAEMRSERFGPEREQFHKAELLLNAALKLDPANMRARYFRALVWRGMGKLREAADELEKIAADYPRDREVQRQLGQTLFTLGRLTEARTSFLNILRIDPTDADAYQYLSPIYLSENRKAEAERAQSLYLLWRDDPLATAIAGRFYAAHPEWHEERNWAHTHGNGSARRPVLSGRFASPED